MDLAEFVDFIDLVISKNGLNLFTCIYYNTVKIFMSIPSTRCHIRPINKDNIYSSLHYAAPLIENMESRGLKWKTHTFTNKYNYNICTVVKNIRSIKDVVASYMLKLDNLSKKVVPRDYLAAAWFIYLTSPVVVPNYNSLDRLFEDTIKLADMDYILSKKNVRNGYIQTTIKPFGTKLVIYAGGLRHEIFAPLIAFYGFEKRFNKSFNEMVMVKKLLDAATSMGRINVYVDGERVLVKWHLVDRWLSVCRESDVSFYEFTIVE